MICSTLLPLTPKSLPPFGGQTQPAHVLLKFADSRRALRAHVPDARADPGEPSVRRAVGLRLILGHRIQRAVRHRAKRTMVEMQDRLVQRPSLDGGLPIRQRQRLRTGGGENVGRIRHRCLPMFVRNLVHCRSLLVRRSAGFNVNGNWCIFLIHANETNRLSSQ